MEIPADERAGLVRLPSLTDEQIADLRTKLSTAKLSLSRDVFAAGVAPVEGITTEDQQRIIWGLLFVHSYLPSVTGSSLQDFIRDICGSVVDGGPVDPVMIDRLAVVLPSFFDIDALRLRSKAVELHVDHAKPFQGARIYTDVRPVFSVGSVEKIVGALIAHTLKVSYFTTEGVREAFFMLDDRDMAQLKDTIGRAEVKARSVRSNMIEKLRLEDFGVATGKE